MKKSLNTVTRKKENEISKRLKEFEEESMERDKKRTRYATMFKTEICHITNCGI